MLMSAGGELMTIIFLIVGIIISRKAKQLNKILPTEYERKARLTQSKAINKLW